MANTPFVSANFDDAVNLQNLRTIGLVADANETSPAAAALNEVPEENENENTNDVVEISEESRELARTNEPGNTTANTTVNSAEQVAAQERAAAAAGNENELLANTEIENREAGLNVAETLLTETGALTEEIEVGAAGPVTEAETETAQPTEEILTTAEEREVEETTAFAPAATPTPETQGLAAATTETEAETEAETAAALETEAAATAAQTTEGTVPPEPEVTLEAAPIEVAAAETPPPIEEQAEELTRLNEVLNNVNGLAGTAPVTGTQQENAENVQNEQQILLQNVSTQLAQAVPPPSIISVLG